MILGKINNNKTICVFALKCVCIHKRKRGRDISFGSFLKYIQQPALNIGAKKKFLSSTKVAGTQTLELSPTACQNSHQQEVQIRSRALTHIGGS